MSQEIEEHTQIENKTLDYEDVLYVGSRDKTHTRDTPTQGTPFPKNNQKQEVELQPSSHTNPALEEPPLLLHTSRLFLHAHNPPHNH